MECRTAASRVPGAGAAECLRHAEDGVARGAVAAIARGAAEAAAGGAGAGGSECV